MPKPDNESSSWKDLLGGGAAGVGTVLVLLPVLAVVFRLPRLDDSKTVGLPVLAILGIMILLGTLALVAMLYKRLELADASQPLALPQGSMRAVIALSLIVLFAIISITLYRTTAKGGGTYGVSGLTEEARNALVLQAGARVQDVVFDHCANGTTEGSTLVRSSDSAASATKSAEREAACLRDQRRYQVTLRASPSPESTDLAKQLLVLVGTLMTSVTSFYFAARSKSDDKTPPRSTDATTAQRTEPTEPGASSGAATVAAAVDTHDHSREPDGCDVAILDVTHDEDLPPSKGGVAAATTPPREG